MDTLAIPPLGKAELEAVFEKIFRNYMIVLLDYSNAFEVSYDAKTRLWMRKRVSRALVSENIVGYMIDKYLVIFQVNTNRVLLVQTVNFVDFRLLPCRNGWDFVIEMMTSDGEAIYLRYIWNRRKEQYESRYCAYAKPNDTLAPYESSVEHQWVRMWIQKEGILSIDNAIFYNYIVRYRVD